MHTFVAEFTLKQKRIGCAQQEKGRSRYDFDTAEQWQEYKSAKEANPKAAFQFGVKMTEGRKTHKDLGKNRDQKLSNQLGKIKNILEKDVSPNVS